MYISNEINGNDPDNEFVFEFWFEFASTYSYLSAARIVDASQRFGIPVRWRPFLLGPIFQSQGWNDSPFNLYPAKGRYMWRDLERRAARYGLPFQKPTGFPRNGLRAARCACALLENSATALYVPAFVGGVYSANFAHDLNIAEESVLVSALHEIGFDDDTVRTIISDAQTDPIKLRLREATDRARALGIFGAPTFTVRRAGNTEPQSSGDSTDSAEIFWGDDRLEDAFEFYIAQRSSLKQGGA